MTVSFNGIGQEIATFYDDGAAAGGPCVVTGNSKLGKAAAGAVFCGVCVWQRDGFDGAVLAGFVTLPYSGTAPSVGYGKLVADGTGGVKSGSSGNTYLIVDVDTTNLLVTFRL